MEEASKDIESAKKNNTRPREKKSLKAKGKNRAVQVMGELCFVIHPQPGENDEETYMQSQISISFEDGVPGRGDSGMIVLNPERTKLLLKILGFSESEFMRKYYCNG